MASLLALACFLPQCGGGLKDSSLPSQWETLVSGTRGNRADVILQEFGLSVLTSLGATCFILANSELSQVVKQLCIMYSSKVL